MDEIRLGIEQYLETKCPLRLLPLGDLYDRMRRMLVRIGCETIADKLEPLAPPVTLSLPRFAKDAGNGFELAFFGALKDELAHLRSAGAEEIRFTSDATSGVGTTFDCLTKVGPIRLTDRMEVTEWVEGEAIGVRHVGLVTGTGRFTLAPEGGGTRFTWEEELAIPLWLGGPAAAKVLELVWVRNLRTLRRRFSA